MNVIEQINSALSNVNDPELHKPVTDLGMVENVTFQDGLVTLKILLTIAGCPMKDRLQSDITKALTDISEVENVELEFGVMSDEQRNF